MKSLFCGLAQYRGILASVVTVASVFSSAVYSHGQSSFRHQRYTKADGLAHDYVYCVIEDRNGFMWFGTRGGLCRFDGYGFRIYRRSPTSMNSIPDNVVNCLAEDRNGVIWIGTLRGGLASLDPQTGQIHRFYVPNAGQSGGTMSVVGLCIDSLNNVWVRTSSTQIHRFNPRSGIWRTVPDVPVSRYAERPSYPMATFANGEIWTMVGSGPIVIDPVSLKMRYALKSSVDHVDKRLTEELFTITNLVELDHEHVLFGYHNHIECLHRSSGTSHFITPSTNRTEVLSVTIFADSSLLSSYSDGILRRSMDIHDGELERVDQEMNVLTGSRLYDIRVAKSGRIFAATSSGIVQLSRVDPLITTWAPRVAKLGRQESVDVRSVVTLRDSSILVGTAAGQMFHYDWSTRDWHLVLDVKGLYSRPLEYSGIVSPNLRRFPLTSIYQSAANGYFIGTSESGFISTSRNFVPLRAYQDSVLSFMGLSLPYSFSTLGMHVYSMYETMSGKLFVGFSDGGIGISVYDSRMDHIRNITLEKKVRGLQIVWRLTPVSTTELLACTSMGLYLVDTESYQVTRIPRIGSFGVTSCIHARGSEWYCGTHGEGVVVYDHQTRTIRRGNASIDIKADDIYSMLRDLDGYVWLTTEKGLIRYDQDNRSQLTFGLVDGLVSSIFMTTAAARAPDGRLYFGTNKGLVIVDPRKVRVVRSTAPVSITRFEVEGRVYRDMVVSGNSIAYDYTPTAMRFTFASLDAEDVGRITYRYRILGYDSTWVATTDSRSVSILNLEPGSYVLQIQASDRLGQWTRAPFTLDLTIHPPPWRHPATLSAGSVLAIGLVGGALMRRRRRRARMIHSMREAREAERRNIAATLHDGPLQELYGIRFVIDGKRTIDKQGIDRIDELATKARREIGELCGDLRSRAEIEGLYFALDDVIVGFTRQHKGLSVDVAMPRSLNSVWVSEAEREALIAILRTSLINVAVHAKAERCSVRLWSEQLRVHLTVSDEGCGLAKEPGKQHGEHSGSGLVLCRSFAAGCGGTYDIRTGESGGTVVSFKTARSWRRLFGRESSAPYEEEPLRSDG